MKKLIVFALLIISLGSCKKEKYPLDENSGDEPQNGISINDENSSTGQMKIASSTILNATNASQIPSQMFAVNQVYKTAYSHMGQPDGSSCSWTSYMLAIGSIARGNGNAYECSPAKVYRIKEKCLEISPNDPKLITTLRSFGNTYDSQYISAIYENGANNPTGRFIAIKKMLTHINTYHAPFLVIGTHYYANGTKGAHYLVVHSIDWKVGGTGSTVYYTDCAFNCINGCSINPNLKSMNFTTFLDRMVERCQVYNMLFLRPN